MKLAIYDRAGRRVSLIADRQFPAGAHTLRWYGKDGSGRSVAAGTYFARLIVGGVMESRKLVRTR